jgi:hypothetical protein
MSLACVYEQSIDTLCKMCLSLFNDAVSTACVASNGKLAVDGELLRMWNEAIVIYEGVSKSFRTVRLERELQMVQLSATRCSCVAIL